MSHTINLEVQMMDTMALEAATRRLGWTAAQGKFNVRTSQEQGLGITIPGWSYPLVIDEAGIAHYSADGSCSQADITKLKIIYGLEKVKLEAQKAGLDYIENGDTSVEVQLGDNRTVKVSFNESTGDCVVDADGFKGSSCEDATEFLTKSLGATKGNERKLDYFASNLELNQEHVSTGDCG